MQPRTVGISAGSAGKVKKARQEVSIADGRAQGPGPRKRVAKDASDNLADDDVVKDQKKIRKRPASTTGQAEATGAAATSDANPEERSLGCSKCRYSQSGCRKCRAQAGPR